MVWRYLLLFLISACLSVPNASAAFIKELGANWEAVSVFLVVVGTITGWIIGKKRQNVVSRMLRDIIKTYNEHKDDPANCEKEIYAFKEKIIDLFSSGKIDNQNFLLLDKRIDDFLRSAREEIIKTKFGKKIPQKLKKEISGSLNDGTISNKELKNMTSFINTSEINSLVKKELRTLLKGWRESKPETEEENISWINKFLGKMWTQERKKKVKDQVVIINLLVSSLLLLIGIYFMIQNDMGAILLILVSLAMSLSTYTFKKNAKNNILIKIFLITLILIGLVLITASKAKTGLLVFLLSSVEIYLILKIAQVKSTKRI